METLKFRLFALAIVAISAGATYYNWMQLNTKGQYSMKMAVFAPIGVVGGIFLLLSPTSGGVPNSTASKVIAMFKRQRTMRSVVK